MKKLRRIIVDSSQTLSKNLIPAKEEKLKRVGIKAQCTAHNNEVAMPM